MSFDPDAFLKGAAPTPAAPAAAGGFDPDAFLGKASAAAPAPAAAPSAPNWPSLYAGFEGLDERVTPEQRNAFAALDRLSTDPQEDRARAINQSYFQSRMPNVSSGLMANNWEAAKQQFVKSEFDVDLKNVSDKSLYKLIAARFKDEADPTGTGEITPGAFWHSLNLPFVELPSAPKNLPDVTLPGQFVSLAVLAGVWNGLKPLLEGLESPLGLATAGAGAELQALRQTYPLAGKALAAMSGFFAGLMGYQTVKALPETKRVLTDPTSSTQAKVEAVTTPAATAVAGVLGALGMALEAVGPKEAPKLMAQMEGKTPGQAAEILRGEAVLTASGPHSDFLNHAANELEQIDAGRAATAEQVLPSPAGPRDPTVSTGTGVATPFEEKMLADWKKQIAAEVADEPVYPVVKPDGVHEWLTPAEETDRAVGVNRASLDRELEEMGLPPTTEAETRTFEEGLQKAASKMKRDPDAGQKLIEKLEEKPKPVSDDDVALLSREVNRLRLERAAAEDAVIEAGAAGDQVALAEARNRAAAARDDYQAAASAIAKAGTQNGRALAFFNIMLKEDYSLAGIERKWTAANSGQALDTAKLKEIGDLHTLLQKTQKAFDDYRAQQGAATVRPPRRAAPPAARPSVVRSFLSEQADAARARIKARMAEGRVSSGLDPLEVADYAIVGAEHLARGITKFSEWGEAMVKELGDHIRPYLKDIFAQSRQQHEDAARLQALKTRTASAIEKMEKQVAAEDFAKQARRPIPLDAEALRLKAEYARVKRLVDLGEKRLAEENRATSDKVLGAFVKWVRAGALSTPTVIEHLTGAAIIRPVMTMAEQGVGYGISKLLPELAARAPREGVPSLRGAVRAEARGITEGLTTGIKGAFDILRNRDTNETALLDKAHLPPEMIEYMGQIHKALHYPTQINEYARALELRTQHAIRNGVDPHDPVQQIRLMHEAWMDGNRSVFLHDNGLVNAYQSAVRALEGKQKATGKPSLALKVLSAGLQTELPIVKVPTNVIAEAFEILTGAVQGPARAAFEYARGGVKDLGPGEADQILRLIKKGSLGAALTALGYYGYESVGGFHVQGEKRAESDVEAGNIAAGPVEIPHGLLHNPYAYAVDFGATMHRAGEAALKHQGIKTDTPEAHALLAASLGVIGDAPFIRESTTIGRYADSRQAGNAFSGKIASILVPGGVAWIAAQLDKPEPFNPGQNPTPRKADGLGDAIKKRVPGQREELPRGKGR